VDVTRRRELSEHTLAQLCGQSAGAFQVTSKQQIAPAVPRVPVAAPASLLRQWPDIAQSERIVAARTAEIGVAIGERLPSLTLNGSLDLESLEACPTGRRLPGAAPSSIGPEVSLAAFSGSANAARVEKAEARRAEAEADYRGSSSLRRSKKWKNALANGRGYEQLAARQEVVRSGRSGSDHLPGAQAVFGWAGQLTWRSWTANGKSSWRGVPLSRLKDTALISAVQLDEGLGRRAGMVAAVSAPE